MIYMYVLKREWMRLKELKFAFFENIRESRTLTTNKYFCTLYEEAEEHENIIKRLLEEGKLIFY